MSRADFGLSNFGIGSCTVNIDPGPSPIPTPFQMDLHPEGFCLDVVALHRQSLNAGGFFTDGLQNFSIQWLQWYFHRRKYKSGESTQSALRTSHLLFKKSSHTRIATNLAMVSFNSYLPVSITIQSVNMNPNTESILDAFAKSTKVITMNRWQRR